MTVAPSDPILFQMYSYWGEEVYSITDDNSLLGRARFVHRGVLLCFEKLKTQIREIEALYNPTAAQKKVQAAEVFGEFVKKLAIAEQQLGAVSESRDKLAQNIAKVAPPETKDNPALAVREEGFLSFLERVETDILRRQILVTDAIKSGDALVLTAVQNAGPYRQKFLFGEKDTSGNPFVESLSELWITMKGDQKALDLLALLNKKIPIVQNVMDKKREEARVMAGVPENTVLLS